MSFSKSTLLSILGLVILISFIGMSYFNDGILLDKIIVCSVLLFMVFFAKMRSDSSNSNANKTNDSNTGMA